MFRRSAHYKICKTVTLISIFLQQFIHAYNMMKNVYYGYGPFVVKKNTTFGFQWTIFDVANEKRV